MQEETAPEPVEEEPPEPPAPEPPAPEPPAPKKRGRPPKAKAEPKAPAKAEPKAPAKAAPGLPKAKPAPKPRARKAPPPPESESDSSSDVEDTLRNVYKHVPVQDMETTILQFLVNRKQSEQTRRKELWSQLAKF